MSSEPGAGQSETFHNKRNGGVVPETPIAAVADRDGGPIGLSSGAQIRHVSIEMVRPGLFDASLVASPEIKMELGRRGEEFCPKPMREYGVFFGGCSVIHRPDRLKLEFGFGEFRFGSVVSRVALG